MDSRVKTAARELVESYSDETIKIHHLDRQPLPSHSEIIRCLVKIHELLFPGYIGLQGIDRSDLEEQVAERLSWLYDVLTEQIYRASGHDTQIGSVSSFSREDAADAASQFL